MPTRIILVLIVCFSVFACTSNNEIPDAQTLVVALSSSPNTLDPRFATDANGMRLSHLLFSSLVKVGPDLKIIGDAAESWKYKDLTYTFILKPGLKFSNGKDLTADDILFSFDEYRSEKNPFQAGLKSIDNISVTNNEGHWKIEIHLKEYSATFLHDLSPVKLLPKDVVTNNASNFSKSPVGTGSFRFVSQSSHEIRLEARFDHSFAAPKIKNLIFKVIQDDNTRYLKTLKGAIDIIQADMPPGKIQALEKNSNFNVIKYPGLSFTYLLFNLRDPLLQRLEVRQAIATCINRKEIIDYKLEGLASEATSILSKNNPYFNSSLKNIPFEPEKGQQLVKKLDIQGKEFLFKTVNNETSIENAKVLAKQLESCGLKIKLQSFEWGTFYNDIKVGQFQLATMRWIGAIDPDIYRIAFSSKEFPPGRNRGAYSNQKLDKLLENGLKIVDDQKRIQHYLSVQEIIHKDLPILPLWYDTQVAIVHKRVKNYVPPANSDFSAFVKVSK